MKILITGGGGMIGSRLISKLGKDDHIFIFTNVMPAGKKPDANLIVGDMKNLDDVDNAFRKQRFDIVYHLAANMDESDGSMYYENIIGTKHFVESAKKHGVKRFIFMGSCGATGYHGISMEDSPYKPNTKYEKSKADSEKIVIESGIPFTVIRAPIILGANGIWAKIFSASRNYPIIGSGKNSFHLAHLDDVASLLALAGKSEKAENQIFNVATRDAKSYEESYIIMRKLMGANGRVKHIPVWTALLAATFHEISCKLTGKKPKLTMMKSSIRRLISDRLVSTEKAKKVLGFVPKYTAESALDDTYKQLKARKML